MESVGRWRGSFVRVAGENTKEIAVSLLGSQISRRKCSIADISREIKKLYALPVGRLVTSTANGRTRYSDRMMKDQNYTLIKERKSVFCRGFDPIWLTPA